ncbi:hypothetical protein A2U01_0094997, partial [Trifolium medium]|nr:hypothetical protein [Trifolium medium]
SACCRWATFLRLPGNVLDSRRAMCRRHCSPEVASYWQTFCYLVATCRQARLGDRDYVKTCLLDV